MENKRKKSGVGRIAINLLVTLAFGLVYFYFELPAINLHDKNAVDKEDRKKETSEVVQDIRSALSNVTGATISVAASNNAVGVSSDTIQFNFSGDNDKELEEAGQMCQYFVCEGKLYGCKTTEQYKE